jgi:hypothetical protein
MNRQLFPLRGSNFLRRPARSGAMKTAVTAFCILLMSVSCSKESTNSFGTRLSKITTIKGRVIWEFSYDSGGRVIKQVAYTSSGSLEREEFRVYDNQGKCVKTETTLNISSPIIAGQPNRFKAEMVYDANNKLKETNNYTVRNGSFQFDSKLVPEYDISGRIVKNTSYDVAGVPYAKSLYQYDAANNISKEEYFYLPSNTPVVVHTYEYDRHRNPVKDLLDLPWRKNENNIVKINTTMSPGSTSTHIIDIKSYTREGFPRVVNEKGEDRVYVYTY